MSRDGERGLMRGCCLGVVFLLVVLALLGFVADRALASPDLGAAPGGANDGDSEVTIAVALGTQVAAQLIAQPHAAVTVSEHDLTVLAAVQNPHPDRYRGVQVRSRNGEMDVSALTSFGPLTVTVLGYVAIGLNMSSSAPELVANVTGMDIGALHIPGWLQGRLLDGFSPTVALNQLFDSSPALEALKSNLECVRVVAGGVRIGIHRPGTSPDTGVCAG